jgi:hypothetical protein
MRTLRKLTNDAGTKYDDARFKTKLIDSFPESWDAIVLICYNMMSLSEVILTLTSHGERVLHNKHPNQSMDTVKALEVSVLALQAEIKMLRSSSRSGNPNKSSLICENKNCGKAGHLAGDCFQIGGGKEVMYPPWWKGK